MNNVTIALTRYSESEELLWKCLESIAMQEHVQARVFVLDQSEHLETRLLCREISSKYIDFNYVIISAQGCAHARNIAIRLCPTDILLWTDPDVILPPDWAFNLSHALLELDCAVVGGRILPQWYKKPQWHMKSNIMADHYSLLDLGLGYCETDRIIGGSMGIHLKRLGNHAFFDERFGRKDGTLLGGVDSTFCQRIIQKGFTICYVGQTTAMHQILESKMKLSWIAKKFFFSGVTRGIRGGRPKTINLKRETVGYILMCAFAPFYLLGFIRGIMIKQRDPAYTDLKK